MCNSRIFTEVSLFNLWFLLEHASSSPREWHLPVQNTYHDHYTWTTRQIIQSTESSLQQDTLHIECHENGGIGGGVQGQPLGSSLLRLAALVLDTTYRHTLYRMEMAHEKSRHTASRITVQAVSYGCTGGEKTHSTPVANWPYHGPIDKALVVFLWE